MSIQHTCEDNVSNTIRIDRFGLALVAWLWVIGVLSAVHATSSDIVASAARTETLPTPSQLATNIEVEPDGYRVARA